MTTARRYPGYPVAALIAVLSLVPFISLAGPKSFSGVGQVPRKWLTQEIRVGWTGEIPNGFSAEDIDQIVGQAFSAWVLPTTGLRFRFDTGNPRTLSTAKDFSQLRLNPPDILIVLTNSPEQIVPPRPDLPPEFSQANLREVAWTFEREIPPPPRLELGPTYTLVDSSFFANRDRELLFSMLFHEAGHALGLEHSAINWQGPDPRQVQRVMPDLPVMTPINFVKRARLHEDDLTSISDLYQAGPFLKQYGWIEGRVVQMNGRVLTPINGVQVLAVRRQDPNSASRLSSVHQYASIPPYGGSADPARQGRFSIPVPPGTYQLSVDSVQPPGFDLQPRVVMYQFNVHGDLAPVPVSAGMSTDVGDIAVTRVP